MVEIHESWTANNRNFDQTKNQELTNLEGQWNLEIKISTTFPYKYLTGPIIINTMSIRDTLFKDFLPK